jgi:outer membrane protein assembly factor BamE (lipoprotein component of BamABCDE complex)
MKFTKGWKLIVSLLCIGLLAACIPALPARDSAVVLAEYDLAVSRYNQIKSGMTYEDIVQIMGSPGEEPQGINPQSATEHPAVPQLPAGTVWEFDQGGCNIKVSLLQSNRTISIKSFTWDGINNMPKRNHLTTLTQFDQVTSGMTYDEVVSILGSPGMLFMSIESFHLASSRADSFVWWPEGKSDATISHSLMVTFRDGVVQSKK